MRRVILLYVRIFPNVNNFEYIIMNGNSRSYLKYLYIGWSVTDDITGMERIGNSNDRYPKEHV